MKLHVKLRWIALSFGAWSYGHAWLAAMTANDRIHVLGLIEAFVAGSAALVLGAASIISMED